MLNSRSLDRLGNSTSWASQETASFISPFCQGDAGKFGILTFCLTLAKDAGVLTDWHRGRSKVTFTLTADPAKTGIVKIVEFDLGLQK